MTEQYDGKKQEGEGTGLIDNEKMLPQFSNEKVEQAFEDGLIENASEEDFRIFREEYFSVIKKIDFIQNYERLITFLQKLEEKFPFVRRSSLFHLSHGSTPPKETIAFDFVNQEDSIRDFIQQEMDRIRNASNVKISNN